MRIQRTAKFIKRVKDWCWNNPTCIKCPYHKNHVCKRIYLSNFHRLPFALNQNYELYARKFFDLE